MSAPTRNRHNTFHNNTFCYKKRINAEFCCSCAIIVFCISFRRSKSFVHNVCTFFVRQTKYIESVDNTFSTNHTSDNIEFLRRYANIFDMSFHKNEEVRKENEILFLLIPRMSAECPRKREFTEFVTDHWF